MQHILNPTVCKTGNSTIAILLNKATQNHSLLSLIPQKLYIYRSLRKHFTYQSNGRDLKIVLMNNQIYHHLKP